MPSLRSKIGAPVRHRPLRRRASRLPRIDPAGRLRRTSRRSRLLAGLVATAVFGAVVWVTRPPDPRAGSVPVRGVARTLGIVRVPESFEVVYRVEDHGGQRVVSTDKLRVRRPFSGRIESWEGEPPGRKRLSQQVTRLGILTTGGSSTPTTLASPPALAGSDLRPDIVLPQAVELGWLERRERRRVYGRQCQVYRAGGPVNAGEITPYKAGSKEYSDVCVDRAGLVLEEAWYTNGRLLRRRAAVRIVEDPRLPDSTFLMDEGTRVPADQGGGSVRRLIPTSRPPGTFWELGTEPAGFTLTGRYAVVPPQAKPQDPTMPDRRMASVVDVWVRGPDVILVDRGGTLQAVSKPLGTHPSARKIDLGALGEGEMILSLRGNEVRVQRTDGSFVRVVGTVSTDVLAELARTMHPTEGNQLVCQQDDGAPVPCVTPPPPPTPAPEGAAEGHEGHEDE